MTVEVTDQVSTHALAPRSGWLRNMHAVMVSALLLVFAMPAAAGERTLYWCAGQGEGRELQVEPLSGCQPLVESEPADHPSDRTSARVITPDNLQATVESFMARYRGFLACCATDLKAKDQLADLQTEANEILRVVERTLSPNKLLQVSGRGLVMSVAQARHTLGKLNGRWEELETAVNRLPRLDYESAGRERRRVEELKRSISKEFSPSL